jgi:hypothetical protein
LEAFEQAIAKLLPELRDNPIMFRDSSLCPPADADRQTLGVAKRTGGGEVGRQDVRLIAAVVEYERAGRGAVGVLFAVEQGPERADA